ncbi:hypothetical protein HKX69_34550 [Streptomyces argyrophyllae]|uniref:Peptidase inhibitor family I36 protein n=1 Tax=Streptomyces argyrophylli TaxID=2726118 RepID=A0A6M4PS00_9ACTN|nr:peptidase inhibitor family I36 protein [Streptomyces argyrophyllae]QJS13978.1 hypothetical protein HKX69_34550 [Streptomyces argyrophyllae]
MFNPARRTSVRQLLVAAGALTAIALSTAPSDAAQPAIQSAPSDCPKGYFCGYKKSNFQELGFRYKDCYKQEIPDGMGSGGSWYNNQTPGTYTGFYDKNGYYLSDSGPAPSSDPYGHWGPVWYVWNWC